MKFIFVLAALTLASSAHADSWLQSVAGPYNCTDLKTAETLSITINGETRELSVVSKNDNKKAALIDETESLAVMQREVGLKQFKLVFPKEKSPTLMMFRTSSEKLLIKKLDQFGDVSNWVLPEFDPEILCELK
jgi:hypothetical protein